MAEERNTRAHFLSAGITGYSSPHLTGGWPEFQITLSYYVDDEGGTPPNREAVDEIAKVALEQIANVLADAPSPKSRTGGDELPSSGREL